MREIDGAASEFRRTNPIKCVDYTASLRPDDEEGTWHPYTNWPGIEAIFLMSPRQGETNLRVPRLVWLTQSIHQGDRVPHE